MLDVKSATSFRRSFLNWSCEEERGVLEASHAFVFHYLNR